MALPVIQKHAPEAATYLAFIALALLAGPVESFSANTMLIAFNGQVYAGSALAALAGGVALLAYALKRRLRLPRGADWLVLLLLLVPQWCWTGLDLLSGTVPWMHRIGDGAGLMIAVAAPLWLGLVAALDVVEIEVPVACVVSAIAGIFAVLLVVPGNSYSLRWTQAPMLALAIALGIAAAVTWAVARRQVAGLSIAGTAGAYLLLSAFGNAFLSWMNERSSWQPIAWRSALLPVVCDAVLAVASWCLWFLLLQRITLGAFGMRALGAWAATAIPAFGAAGVLQWRVDAAFVIAVVSCAIALKARAAEEQPTVLGLGEP